MTPPPVARSCSPRDRSTRRNCCSCPASDPARPCSGSASAWSPIARRWAGISRIVRGQTLSIKEKEYVEAARSLGAGPWRIMFIHILPNLLGPVLVLATLYIPTAIVFEATLSFLGIGIPAPAASWGSMLSEAQNFYQVAWWYVVFPAAALLITTLAFNLLGDGIRDAMDPRTERLFAATKEAGITTELVVVDDHHSDLITLHQAPSTSGYHTEYREFAGAHELRASRHDQALERRWVRRLIASSGDTTFNACY